MERIIINKRHLEKDVFLIDFFIDFFFYYYRVGRENERIRWESNSIPYLEKVVLPFCLVNIVWAKTKKLLYGCLWKVTVGWFDKLEVLTNLLAVKLVDNRELR